MGRASERAQSPFSAIAGVALAAVLCVAGSVQHYQFESAYQQQNPDPYQISAQFVRLAPVRRAVPESAILGYLTDAQPGSIVDSALLGGARYVLAPRLVVRETTQDWVLGNFTRPADFAAIGRSAGLRLQQDFGNGVVLFRRESRP
jgi:uncharacterized membrane protein (UPF0136 family)